MLMGLSPYTDVPVSEITLYPGDRILFYTDGATDRFNTSDERYGTDRLLQKFKTAASDDPEVILKEIVDDILQFAGDSPADDDQAMIVFVVD
jgi:sigma-B regulation protein RsbU (phosphoserine phosphatase)